MMSKKEKILWIILSLLIIIIVIGAFVILLNKKKNVDNSDYIDKLSGYTWKYIDSFFYDDGSATMKLFNLFELRFYDAYVELCMEDGCSAYKYHINDNYLTIESTVINGYKISFEEEYLLLEYIYDDGSRLVYRFVTPVG